MTSAIPAWVGCEAADHSSPLSLKSNLDAVLQSLSDSCAASGRPSSDVRLLAVSKKFPADAILEMAAFGQSHFGENYVQEMQAKAPAVEALRPQTQFHMIGPLQRNKVNAALKLFDTIQSVNSLELLSAICQRSQNGIRTKQLLIQVRLGDEDTKSGFDPDQVLSQLDQWFESEGQAQLDSCPKIVGFMTIPPAVDKAEDNRAYFAQLRVIREQALAQKCPWLHGRELSMGMSDDFQVAIQEGATWVRVGRALFGERR